ncbi:MAG: homospermidine synthase [Rhodospirillales bacterium]|nr:homospermidine synthase [Rhodospirillales bacterium]
MKTVTDGKVAFAGRIVMLGCGSIGQGVLALLFKHIDITPDRMTVIAADETGSEVARSYSVTFEQVTLTQENYRKVVGGRLQPGDFLLNLSVDVSSLALIEMAAEKGALYLDTCIEPWLGGYVDMHLSLADRSNYGLWLKSKELRGKLGSDAPTAVVTHGANPGLVSHFVKQALINIARGLGRDDTPPSNRAGWAKLAQSLGIKVIHIAERDTQVANIPKAVGEFVNTWSIDGFVGEGLQPAELGWGTHERHFPGDGRRHNYGPGSAIYLMRPGCSQRVRTWTPLEGPFHGFLITHGESISLASYLTVEEGSEAVYRPTVHYAYHPADDAVLSLHELNGKNGIAQTRRRLMMDEIVSGVDELGVLLCGHDKGAYWYGSQLSIEEARNVAPHNNATSLQVTSPVMAGVIWAIENPKRGITDPEEMDFQRILDLCGPYLGPVVGKYSDWTPLTGRERLFPEDLDREDPWQFKNFRVL